MAGRDTGLRYTPNVKGLFVHIHLDRKMSGGERGIRTPGTNFSVRQFSKLLVSATHPPLRWMFKERAQK